MCCAHCLFNILLLNRNKSLSLITTFTTNHLIARISYCYLTGSTGDASLAAIEDTKPVINTNTTNNTTTTTTPADTTSEAPAMEGEVEAEEVAQDAAMDSSE